ncbi:b148.1 [miniopterid betaherpesvirus 1]|uniref:B148.1 n=1 Tax=miniopterid betaherpesvirus 1 TaxID=3070189 RepID=I3VQD2_9BETA|nr:b148.1 [miniopterid betaherpesvirus 1]AFK83976.1 b148.1 [miniopterid betaherpesvirus 1]
MASTAIATTSPITTSNSTLNGTRVAVDVYDSNPWLWLWLCALLILPIAVAVCYIYRERCRAILERLRPRCRSVADRLSTCCHRPSEERRYGDVRYSGPCNGM